jgi:putative flippase GtrA
MLEKLISLKNNYTVRTFIIYCFIGFTGLFIDVGLYLLLVYTFDITPYISNIASVLLGLNYNFAMNAYFNFKMSDKIFSRWSQFMTIGVFGMFISEGLIFIFLEYFKWDPDISKYATIPIIAVIQYYLHRRFTFKS